MKKIPSVKAKKKGAERATDGKESHQNQKKSNEAPLKAPEDYIRAHEARAPEEIRSSRSRAMLGGDPDGDNRPTLPDGRRYSLAIQMTKNL
jgi:hypothetical protein